MREGDSGVGVIAGVLLALVVVGLGLFFLFGRGDGDVTIVETPDVQVETPEAPAAPAGD